MMQLNLRKGFAFAAALLLVGAAIAVAVATHGSSASSKGADIRMLAKLGGDPDAQASMKATPGEESPGAAQWAAEDYSHRAYPAEEIPFQAQVNARKGFALIQARTQGSGTASRSFSKTSAASANPGSWTALGPHGVNQPAVLNFFSRDYVTSGRTTAVAISPACNETTCTMWIGAAGGGVWRTDRALSKPGNQGWKWVSGPFGTNAIGTLRLYGNTLYAGTGEPHASGDSEAGLGIYKSTDGGTSWTKLPSVTHTVSPANGDYTGDAFAGRAVSEIIQDPLNPQHLLVSSTRAVRGVAQTTGNATSNPPPPRPPFGLFESFDGGQTFNFIWDGNGTIRGVSRVAIDPSLPNVYYASAYQQGVWRSKDAGATWQQILPPVDPLLNTDRAEFAITKTPNGKTRLYVQDGAQQRTAATLSRVYRIDDASSASPVVTDLTQPGISQDICTAQCWYDNVIYTPPGHPDIVYAGGSYDYSLFGFTNNGRSVILSTDAGAHWHDMTGDAQEGNNPGPWQPDQKSRNSLHPDQHGIVTHPSNPLLFWSTSDGGVVRSSGQLTDISSECDQRGLGPISTARCKQLLSRVPTRLTSLNPGLNTLQFQSLSINPSNTSQLMGGTQDNGTFQSPDPLVAGAWPQIMYGDGGLSGWNAVNPNLRFNSFFGQFHDANFRNGDPESWVVIGGPIAASPEFSNFYAPIIPDPHPARAGTIFQGSQSVWRTRDWGGDQAYLEANCPEFFTSGADPDCGDFQRIGSPSDLTSTAFGPDRAVCCVSWLARTPSDTGTLWASTNGGRLFITKNAGAGAGSVVWTRLDSLATADPGRSITTVFVDPANSNHAWVSYTGYNFNTPTRSGHVFSVKYDPVGGTATWTNWDGQSSGISGPQQLPDLPITSVVYDDVKGDLYASTDFGVLRRAAGTFGWTVAGTGLPGVEVAGLSIAPGDRKLYAATHGMGAWLLNLPTS